MQPPIDNASRRKQLRIWSILVLFLCVIVLNPIIRFGVQRLLPRAPVRLGNAEISIPKTWMLSSDATRVTVWKPCITVFCGSPQASFVLEVKDLPEDVWERAATKIFRDNYSAEVTTKTINNGSATTKCLELNSALADGSVVASCINPDLHLTSTFTGNSSLRSAFYAILATAHKRS